MQNQNAITLRIRIIQAVGFELIGLIISTPLAAWILSKSLMTMSVLTVLVSFIATAWYFIFNYLYDKIESKIGLDRFSRSIKNRINHTIWFELTLQLFVLPLIAYWLKTTLIEAFLINIGIVCFYMLHAFVYNWAFDIIYMTISKRKHQTSKID
jgi:uncharacterized membrane protein